MDIGEKVRQLRLRLGLTQEELAARTELSKGFISQLENNITSPSIATLMDILETLGTSAAEFFRDQQEGKVVYRSEDMFVKEGEDGSSVTWLVTDAQKYEMEPILVRIPPEASTEEDDPHDGEEFGYVLSGGIILHLNGDSYRLKKGDSFYFRPVSIHYLSNPGKREARVLWVSTPPSF